MWGRRCNGEVWGGDKGRCPPDWLMVHLGLDRHTSIQPDQMMVAFQPALKVVGWSCMNSNDGFGLPEEDDNVFCQLAAAACLACCILAICCGDGHTHTTQHNTMHSYLLSPGKVLMLHFNLCFVLLVCM